MSLNLLRITLSRLSSSEPVAIRSVFKDAFTLFEHLINPKNIDILARALLSSIVWEETTEYSISHDLMYATRYLSSEKATLHNKDLLKAIRETQCPAWRKSVVLAALTYAEMRGTKASNLAWLSSKGKYGRTYMNSVAQDDNAAHCALLVCLSYIWPYLTTYQQGRLSDDCKIGCIQGLYEGDMLLDRSTGHLKTTSSFKELGLLSRTVSLVCIDLSLASIRKALLILSTATSSFADRYVSSNIARPLFLSIVTIQQAVLVSTVQHSLSPALSEAIATKSLAILHDMQGVNPDNSVFESWRFCFNLSLDMLANEPRALTAYVDNLLQSSPLSRNPMSTLSHQGLYSRIRDDTDVIWALTIVESTAAIIQSKEACQRIFDHCFDKMLHADDTENKEILELYHSVILSFISAKNNLFADRVSGYIHYVLLHIDSINDRQFQLIFTTLYRLSLMTSIPDECEDPSGILGALKTALRTSQDVSQQDKLLSTLIEMLPIISPAFLSDNLRYTEHKIWVSESSKPLLQKFNDVCTTEMDSERAVITVKYMLSRNDDNCQEKARL